jgi:hypothetical protein
MDNINHALPLLIGMVAKGKDFAVTKGVGFAIGVIFSAGVMFAQFNALLSEVKKSNAEMIEMKRDMGFMKIEIINLKNDINNNTHKVIDKPPVI